MAVLYFAKEILIPLALALLFSFLPAPLVRRLERFGLWRVPSVLLVAAAFFCVFGLIGWLTASQVIELAAKVPGYQDNIERKLEALRGGGGPLQRAVQVIATVEKKVTEDRKEPAAAPKESANGLEASTSAKEKPPVPVRVLIVPVKTEGDEMAGKMLAHLFELGSVGSGWLLRARWTTKRSISSPNARSTSFASPPCVCLR